MNHDTIIAGGGFTELSEAVANGVQRGSWVHPLVSG